MIVRSLDVKNYPFRPQENGKPLIDLEVLYLSAIGALMHLTNNIGSDILFVVNLLTRYNLAPTQRQVELS